MTIKNKAEYIAVKSLYTILNLFPYSGLMRFSRLLGTIVFSVFRFRRQVTLENIRNAFPEISKKKIFQIGKNAYRHFAMIFLELIKFGKMSSDEFLDRIDVKTPEIIEEILQNKKGQIILIGHFGSWEVFALYFSTIKKFAAIAKKQKDPVIENFILSLRTKFGGEIFYSREPVSKGIKWLKDGNTFAIVGDQDARHHGIFVPFLGQLASTYTGVSIYAQRSKADVYFATPIRIEGGKYEISIEKIHNSDNGITKNFGKNLITLYKAKLEEAVRKNPEQYFWMHKRWKTKPPEEKDG